MKKGLLLIMLLSIVTVLSQNKKLELVNLSINDANSSFGPSFYGKNIVFTSSNNGKLHLYSGEFTNDDVKNKKLFFKGETNETNAVFTNNLQTMYFTRSLYGEENTVYSSKDKRPVIGIFKATRASDGSWAQITPLPFNSENYDVGHPALNRDNTKLYFSSNMKGTMGKTDIFVVDILGNNKYSEPRNLGKTINSTGNDIYPFISRENILYFTSNRKGGFGGLDIYSVDLNQSTPKVVHLSSPINSKYDDFSYIYNKSLDQGFLTTNRPNGKGSDDIYLVKEKEDKEEVAETVPEKKEKTGCNQKLIGAVFLNASQIRVKNALVKLKDDNEKVVSQFQTKDDAKFHFNIKCNKKYKIEAHKKGYKTTERLMITNAQDDIISKKNIFLAKELKKGEKKEFLYVGTVDFEYNKWNLRKHATYELDKAIIYMNQNPNLVIHFESHTDSRAEADFNMELSKNRIEVLKEYVGFKGIFRKRFSGEAFGETKPINKCVKGVQCTEEEYLANRRTTFVLKEKK